ncbi:phosphonate C-P lyase system protein PhnG [Marinobacter salinus]|uniref:Phosphonate C-P lyase system protein PhnG n=1 Tax=Marinobacter salinus TaxID=1874317 RepID=A0A1D9GKZ1_9GAMM|nr:phosphonate C-P lyase system protein PhnG [Marinobacter salinus]AOY88308.1 phosphonate C-P lyase system protein PhnG [Marinobacter salinus]
MTIANTFSESPEANPEVTARQHWMSVLARADLDALESYWQNLTQKPSYRCLRKPEIGLAMVRGRAGGAGAPFNLGEVTVTRCVVELEAGAQGFGYVTGRSRRHAELAALFDGLMQQDSNQHGPALIQPLYRQWLARREQVSRKAAATKVNFMTMVRGESGQ